MIKKDYFNKSCRVGKAKRAHRHQTVGTLRFAHPTIFLLLNLSTLALAETPPPPALQSAPPASIVMPSPSSPAQSTAPLATAAPPTAPPTAPSAAMPPSTLPPSTLTTAAPSPLASAPLSAATPTEISSMPSPADNSPMAIDNAPNNVPNNVPSQADAAQFQAWLKNNEPKVSQKMLAHGHIHKHVTHRNWQKQNMIAMGPNAPEVESPPMSYKQSQQIMLKSAPSAPPPNADSKIAYDAMIQQNVPLTPQQVVKLRQVIDRSQRAAAIPATVPPKPVSSTLLINLAPGATPPAIRLAQGYVSSLVFVDSTGAPWPLASYDIGDPKTVNIQWDGKSNILLMQAISPYSEGNLVVSLVGLPTPVTLEIVSGQRVVDYRTDIHVPGIGPNSKDLPIGTGLPNSANQLLLGVLDGVAPPGSKQLTIPGGGTECQAWLLGDRMYLRTRFTVLSPGWIGKMSSPDGMYAYEMQKTSSVLISQYGNPIEMKIEGF